MRKEAPEGLPVALYPHSAHPATTRASLPKRIASGASLRKKGAFASSASHLWREGHALLQEALLQVEEIPNSSAPFVQLRRGKNFSQPGMEGIRQKNEEV
jgi:hypothetical protein